MDCVQSTRFHLTRVFSAKVSCGSKHLGVNFLDWNMSHKDGWFMTNLAWQRHLWLGMVSLFAFAVGCEPEPQPPVVAQQVVTPPVVAPPVVAPEASKMEPSPASFVATIMIEIEIRGFQNEEGNCPIAVYLGPDHFNDSDFAVTKEVVSIKDGTASWTAVVPRPEGAADWNGLSFAISAYHDQNGNQKLDKNSFGIPTERYGFSKNPKRGFGPPRYRETKMDVTMPDNGPSPFDTPISVSIQIQ